jgi:hypothetical protein
MSIESQHVKNEQLFCNGGKDTVVDMVVMGDVLGEKNKEAYTICCNFLTFEARSSCD